MNAPTRSPPLPTPVMKFFADGLAHIQRLKATGRDPCFQIRPGMDEWTSWRTYLMGRIGPLPRVMQMAERREVDTFTAPDQWPEWFDPRYVPPPYPAAPPARDRYIGPEERARVGARFDRLVETLGNSLSMQEALAKRGRAERAKRRQAEEEAHRPAGEVDVPLTDAERLSPSPGLLANLAERKWSDEHDR